MKYESVVSVESKISPGVLYSIAKMSYGRRVELMRRIRELAGRMEFLEAGRGPAEKMDASLLETEINRIYLAWGLRAVSGLILDGEEATPELLVDRGPEDLFREAIDAVRAQTGLTETERKN